MSRSAARYRVAVAAWIAVFLAAGFLEIQTIGSMEQFGLTGIRPPLPLTPTVLRILIFVAALVLLGFSRGRLNRATLLVIAAAAGWTSLYGLGYRSTGLLAFRLLSHLAAYALIMAVACRRLVLAKKTSG